MPKKIPPINKTEKVHFGEQTDSGYKYHAKINFKEDLGVQIGRLIREKKAKDELDTHISKLRKISEQFKNKEKNIAYYSAIGNALSFFDGENFRDVGPYSFFRRVIDAIPDILPGMDAKRMQDHLMMMYRIGKLDSKTLNSATWDQWYEISKFKEAFRNKEILERVIVLTKSDSRSDLREEIQNLLSKHTQ
jgi:hypothetical protein